MDTSQLRLFSLIPPSLSSIQILSEYDRCHVPSDIRGNIRGVFASGGETTFIYNTIDHLKIAIFLFLFHCVSVGGWGTLAVKDAILGGAISPSNFTN
jgi:hypothetical protein